MITRGRFKELLSLGCTVENTFRPEKKKNSPRVPELERKSLTSEARIYDVLLAWGTKKPFLTAELGGKSTSHENPIILRKSAVSPDSGGEECEVGVPGQGKN